LVLPEVGGGIGAAGDDPEEILVSCGSNDFAELGQLLSADGESAASDFPTVVDLGLARGERVEMLRGGQRHVIAVISDGAVQRVVGWGANRKGELDTSALDITSSRGRHDANGTPEGTTEDGRVKGKGKAGTAGKSTLRPPTLPPTALELPISSGARIVDLRLGASHSLALLSDGSVLAWGSDTKGQISGIASLSDVSRIAATWGGSYFIRQARDGAELLSQGANTYSQLLRPLGETGRDSVRLPPGAVARLAAGSEHMLAQIETDSGGLRESELYVGGWNEHGNLGLGDQKDRSGLVRVEQIAGGSETHRIKGIWGGCGSSFVELESWERQ
jgi:protein ATS1